MYVVICVVRPLHLYLQTAFPENIVCILMLNYIFPGKGWSSLQLNFTEINIVYMYVIYEYF